MSIDRFKSKLKNRLEVEIYIIDSCDISLNTKQILLVELYDSLCSYNPLFNLNMVTKFENRKKCLSIECVVVKFTVSK